MPHNVQDKTMCPPTPEKAKGVTMQRNDVISQHCLVCSSHNQRSKNTACSTMMWKANWSTNIVSLSERRAQFYASYDDSAWRQFSPQRRSQRFVTERNYLALRWWHETSPFQLQAWFCPTECQEFYLEVADLIKTLASFFHLVSCGNSCTK